MWCLVTSDSHVLPPWRLVIRVTRPESRPVNRRLNGTLLLLDAGRRRVSRADSEGNHAHRLPPQPPTPHRSVLALIASSEVALPPKS
ncbi:hypothetical protein E2C01_058982 [Portunus trituberculatus]|uniref:Uncharacterized protein n=1 Tax=Portunus trituberculatus TaxID=210409 RepID=A0A5B7GXU9_PORTR|nr:hypothetical protein [Portunus trituberculatus]